jgi:hypothetical protein
VTVGGRPHALHRELRHGRGLPGAGFPVAGTGKGLPGPGLALRDAKVTGRLWRIAVDILDAALRFLARHRKLTS